MVSHGHGAHANPIRVRAQPLRNIVFENRFFEILVHRFHASWNRPTRSRIAPVKAPRTCPNNADSSKSAGIAAQFTATNGPLLRVECWWIARATTSLSGAALSRDKHRGFAMLKRFYQA